MKRDELLTTAGETLAYAEDYVETKIELIKLGIADKGARVGAEALSGVAVGILGLIATVFFLVALALWLGSLLGAAALGFLIVGAVIAIVAGVVFAMRRSLLQVPILKAIIASLFKPADDDPVVDRPAAHAAAAARLARRNAAPNPATDVRQ